MCFVNEVAMYVNNTIVCESIDQAAANPISSAYIYMRARVYEQEESTCTIITFKIPKE